jgi:hypothetical protein
VRISFCVSACSLSEPSPDLRHAARWIGQCMTLAPPRPRLLGPRASEPSRVARNGGSRDLGCTYTSRCTNHRISLT